MKEGSWKVRRPFWHSIFVAPIGASPHVNSLDGDGIEVDGEDDDGICVWMKVGTIGGVGMNDWLQLGCFSSHSQVGRHPSFKTSHSSHNSTF